MCCYAGTKNLESERGPPSFPTPRRAAVPPPPPPRPLGPVLALD